MSERILENNSAVKSTDKMCILITKGCPPGKIYIMPTEWAKEIARLDPEAEWMEIG